MKNILSAILILLLFSCSSRKQNAPYDNRQYESNTPAGNNVAAEDKSAAAKTDESLVQEEKIEKKVIRTADTRFKVKDVKKATLDIEKITAANDGFIQSSMLKSDIMRTEHQSLSADSLMEIQEIYFSNEITIRVPVEKFDTVLNALSKLQVFLDFRRINADDVSLDYYGNKLKLKNYRETQNRIRQAVDNKGRRLSDIVDAEQTASNLNSNAIDNRISNLNIDAKVSFSSINVYIYQPNFLFKNVIPDYDVDSYTPSFWHKMWDALKFGWRIILEFVIFIARLWSLILIGTGIYFAIRIGIKISNRKRQNS